MTTSTKRLIKPNRPIVSKFVTTIVNFLREKMGEDVYTNLRISNPMKKVNQDLSWIVGFSSFASKNLEKVFDELQSVGIEVHDLSGSATEKSFISLKISLHLPEEFLREYGDSSIVEYCDEYHDTEELKTSSREEEKEEEKETTPPANNTPDPDDGEQPEEEEEEEEEEEKEFEITTIDELEVFIEDLDGRNRTRQIGIFFKDRLHEAGISDFSLLPRTAYKFQGNDPEFVARVTNPDDISKAQKLFESLGCSVDVVGSKKNAVQVRFLRKDNERGQKKAEKIAPPSNHSLENVQELLEQIKGLEGKPRTRKVTAFFVSQIPGTLKAEVVQRTLPQYFVEDIDSYPELVVRFKTSTSANKILEVFKSLGVDVDIVGNEDRIVRIKSLTIPGRTVQQTSPMKPTLNTKKSSQPPAVSTEPSPEEQTDVLGLIQKVLEKKNLSEEDLKRLRRLSELKQREAELLAEIGGKLSELVEIQGSLRRD